MGSLEITAGSSQQHKFPGFDKWPGREEIEINTPQANLQNAIESHALPAFACD
jgi:hypothetical protein